MLIDRNRLIKIISTSLGIMDEKQLNSLEELEKWEGNRFIPDSKRKHEYLKISKKSLKGETPSLILSYIIEGTGIPLEIKINQESNYSRIILKFNGTLVAYSPFMQDIYGNTIQKRVLATIDVQEVKSHLRDLL